MAEKSKDKLKGFVKDEVTKMFESVLDYAQVACPTPETYKVLRSKILRVGNNCIRVIHKNLDRYDIEYKAIGEDIIEFEEAKAITEKE
jgi:hypothetical protein